MTIVSLLANFPNYSARRVRRLATQLLYLERINSKEAKGIGQDLLDYNLLQAQTEDRLNDDVKLPGQTAAAKWWRISPQPPISLDAAIEEMAEMREDWVQLAKACGFETFEDPDNIINKVRELMADQLKPNQTSEQVSVTPLNIVTQVIRDFEQLGTTIDEDGSVHRSVAARARGLVNSHSFFATRITTHEDDGSRTVSSR